MWFARRPGTERIVRVEAAPKIVTVPVIVPMPPPAPPTTPPPPVAPPSHVQVRAAPAKVVAPPPAPQVVRPTDVTTRYREVGQLLRARGSDELWQRYRWIRLGDCLMTDDKRAECVKMLDAIASDATGK